MLLWLSELTECVVHRCERNIGLVWCEYHRAVWVVILANCTSSVLTLNWTGVLFILQPTLTITVDLEDLFVKISTHAANGLLNCSSLQMQNLVMIEKENFSLINFVLLWSESKRFLQNIRGPQSVLNHDIKWNCCKSSGQKTIF